MPDRCQCINQNHGPDGCQNEAWMHHFCGPCQSEGAIRRPQPEQVTVTLERLTEVLMLLSSNVEFVEALCAIGLGLTANDAAEASRMLFDELRKERT